MQTDLYAIQSVYECAAHLEVHVSEVSDLLACEFSHALREILNVLGNEIEESFWHDLVAPLKRYRSQMVINVLPLNHVQLFPHESLQPLRYQRSSAIRRKPQLEIAFQTLIDALEMLAEDGGTPLLNQMIRIQSVKAVEREAILVGSEQFRETTIASIIELISPSLEVVSAKQLRQPLYFDRLFVTGPATWYAEHVIAAPKAPRVEVVRFDWLADPLKVESAFMRPVQKSTRLLSMTSTPKIATTSDMRPRLTREQVANTINFQQFAALHKPPHNSRDELVTARLVMLEGNQGVFLESESFVFVIDPFAPESERVHRVELTDLKIDDYLILRTVSGGDQISELAAQTLGARGHQIQKFQGEWKSKFNHFEMMHGIEHIVRELKRAGGTRAVTEGNVRNWLEPYTIKPRSDADFRAILELCNLTAESKRYFDAAKALAGAHISAGQEIRRQLIDRLRSMDLQTLERNGWVEVELTTGGGALAVWRVIGISQDTARVGVTHLGQRISLRV